MLDRSHELGSGRDTESRSGLSLDRLIRNLAGARRREDALVFGQPAEIFFACPRCEMGHYAMCRLPPTGGETVFGFAISEPRVYWGCRACVRCKAKLVGPWELRLRC